jgi:hypothetical protein
MRNPLIKIAAALLALALSFPALSLEKCNSAVQAQQHCPKDNVVWLNLPTMISHYRGHGWYGATQNGAYVCCHEASAEGARGISTGNSLAATWRRR